MPGDPRQFSASGGALAKALTEELMRCSSSLLKPRHAPNQAVMDH